MSEYEVRKARHGKWGVYMPNGEILDSFIAEQKAKNRADILNRGNAALHATIEAQRQRIAELEAANQQMKQALQGIAAHAPEATAKIAAKALISASTTQPTPAAAPVADAPVQDEGFTMMNAVVRSIIRYTTKHNEVMAVLTTDKGEIVVFPRSWYEYKTVITEALVTGQLLPFRTKPDNSKGYTQYIFQGIEGVEPAEFPPVAEDEEAPAPRFKVGDKVRSKSQRYEDGEYDVISRANGFGEFVLHGTYLTTCFEGELEAYSENEGE